MSLMNEKLHVINSSGIEVTYKLFTDKSDWKNSEYLQSPCLHVITANEEEGVCPLVQNDSTASNNLAIYGGKQTVDGVTKDVYYIPVNAQCGLCLACTNTVSGSTVTKKITAIYKTFHVDYNIEIVIYNGNGDALYTNVISADTEKLSVNVSLTSSNGFYWSAYIPEKHSYRTIEFSPNVENLYVNGSFNNYVGTSAFSVIAKDYDGTIIDDSNIKITMSVAYVDSDYNPSIDQSYEKYIYYNKKFYKKYSTITQYGKWDSVYIIYSYIPTFQNIFMEITVYNTLVKTEIATWLVNWWGNIYWDLPTIHFAEKTDAETSEKTILFTKAALSNNSTIQLDSYNIPFDAYELSVYKDITINAVILNNFKTSSPATDVYLASGAVISQTVFGETLLQTQLTFSEAVYHTYYIKFTVWGNDSTDFSTARAICSSEMYTINAGDTSVTLNKEFGGGTTWSSTAITLFWGFMISIDLSNWTNYCCVQSSAMDYPYSYPTPVIGSVTAKL